ncbi:MAG TPA: CPBP family intramembrane glutamic endopeptidase [Pseudonocardiaceae bacterium]|nr:CPBP family intramembrane glutamic endopeptidase [Pseudonocardiaceae bacterium]
MRDLLGLGDVSRPSYNPPAAGWWRWGLRAGAIVLAAIYLRNVELGSWQGLSELVHHGAAVGLDGYSYGSFLASYLMLAGLAVGAGACLLIADGPAAVGLRPKVRWTGHARTLTAMCVGPMVVTSLALAAFILTWRLFGGQVAQGLPFGPGAPLWFIAAASLLTAIGEETILLAVIMRLLDYLPAGAGRVVGRTVGAIVIVAMIRLSYHSYQGLTALPDILPPAVLIPIIYRRSGALVPIVIGHALIDFTGQFPIVARLVFYAVVVAAWMWAGKPFKEPVRVRDLAPRETRVLVEQTE